ncbi:MAG TPA: helix-turn-helix transcriptional regulator [Chloroflexia bacterium]|jgi:transcriptional regulator with XRE-family HTH domain
MSSNNADQQSSKLGRLLKHYRQNAQMRRSDLAEKLNLPEGTLSAYEMGRRRPPRQIVLSLAEALSLNAAQIDDLLNVAGHTRSTYLATGPNPRLAQSYGDFGEMLESKSASDEQHVLTLEELMAQSSSGRDQDLEELRGAIDSLVATVGELKSQIQDPAVQATAETAIEAAAQVQELSHNLTAPIYSPVRESLGVRLVPITEVDKINEYQGEESKWYAIAAVLAGVMLGIVQNITTGGDWTPYAWYAFGASGVLGAICGWTAWRYGQKAKQARRQAESREWVAWDVFERGRQ